MKAVVNDRAALESVTPSTAEAYLRTAGWAEVRRVDGFVSIWRRVDDVSGQRFELLVPLDVDLADYAERMAEFFRKLEVIEGRSASDIFRTLQLATVDSMEIQLDRTDSADGSIPFLAGTQAFKGTRSLLIAAAASEFARRPVHPPGVPTAAREALRHTRLGQTRHGSYVITVTSRIPAMQEDLPLLGGGQNEPVERRVMRRAALALDAVRAASTSGRSEAFEDGVTYGISANLCSAVAKLGEGKKVRAVRITLSWASVLPVPDGTPRQIVFTPRSFPAIRQAATELRLVQSQPGFILRGHPIQFRRTEGMLEGAVVVKGPVDAQEREVSMNLIPEHYELAWEAHRTGREVSCVGELLVRGGAFKLLGVTRFVIG